jgi:hypothetical protein
VARLRLRLKLARDARAASISSAASSQDVVLAFGSFAVASAIFLILELNQPFSGLFRVPSAPIERAIAVLGKSPS